jgi:hypothetical protein
MLVLLLTARRLKSIFLATAATGEFNPGIICSIEAPDHFSLFENSSPKPDLARKVANLPKI